MQLVSHHKDDDELAHIKDQVSTIKEAISTLEELDKVGYAEDLITLRKELAVAVLHQVKMMKQRTEQYKQSRTAEDTADNFANQLVTSPTLSVFPRSTPLSTLGSPDVGATQYLPTPDMIVEEEEEHWIQFENASQFEKLLYASFGKVTAGSDSSWTRVQPCVIAGFYSPGCYSRFFG